MGSVLLVSLLMVFALPPAAAAYSAPTSLGLPTGSSWFYLYLLPSGFIYPVMSNVNDFGQFATSNGQVFFADSELSGPWQSVNTLGGTSADLIAQLTQLTAKKPTAGSVNSWGKVVGYSETGAGDITHAFAWTEGTGTQDLGYLPGRPYSYASFVNDAGWIAGSSYTFDGYGKVFVDVPSQATWSWPPPSPLVPGMHELGEAGILDVLAFNDRGQTVVFSPGSEISDWSGSLSADPTIWEAMADGTLQATPIEMGTWTNWGGFTGDFDINNAGQVVTIGYQSSGQEGVLLWQAGALGSPPTVLGSPFSGAAQVTRVVINDRGQVLAKSIFGYHPSLWDPNLGWTEILPGSEVCIWEPEPPPYTCTWADAFGLNSEGQVVGYKGTISKSTANGYDVDVTYDHVPFIWSLDSGMEILPLPSGAYAGGALAISDAGQVVGMQWEPLSRTCSSPSTSCGFYDYPWGVVVPNTESFILWQRDTDGIGDGIDNSLDSSSPEFNDCPYNPNPGPGYCPQYYGTTNDGTTWGQITARNSNRIAVVDVPPGLIPDYDGVKILNLGNNPGNPTVTFEACGSAYPPITGQGGAYVKCNTLHLAVGAGEWTMEVPGNPVVVPQGAAVIADETGPGELSITSDPESAAVITVGGVPLHPGESITVTTNSPPVAAIDGPDSGAVYAAGTPVAFTGSFTDADAGDTHTATWDFDGVTVPGTVSESGGVGTVTADYSFLTPGIYHATLTVTDAAGASGSADTVGDLPAFVVVYDPEGGFVTGGGWIDSTPGAYARDLTLTGKATFGFVSKYQKGGSVPTGETEFQFKVADFAFHSTAYDWLVCGGPKCQYKGHGTVNGAGNYGFLLTAVDGALPGGGGQDKIRMKVWDQFTGQVVYDNQMGAYDFADPATVIGGGSIVIHKG